MLLAGALWLRYPLTRSPQTSPQVRESPFGGDLTFSEDALVLRQNAELADNYGNLVHRATVLCKKDADSKARGGVAGLGG